MTAPAPRPSNDDAPPLLAVRNLVKHFPVGQTFLGGGALVRAVDGIDFAVMPGETLGIVGESGCGKSTAARLVMHLMQPTSGDLLFQGKTVGSPELPLTEFRRQVQMVFQDSYASLNPRLTTEASIAFGPEVHGLSRRAAIDRAHDLLGRVGLDPTRFAGRYPHELSGGQRQRLMVARALMLSPRLLVADEPVSMVDASLRMTILGNLQRLKDRHGISVIYITHDLATAYHVSDYVFVLNKGRVVEAGPPGAVIEDPRHPYTRALVDAIPWPDPDRRWGGASVEGSGWADDPVVRGQSPGFQLSEAP